MFEIAQGYMIYFSRNSAWILEGKVNWKSLTRKVLPTDMNRQQEENMHNVFSGCYHARL